MKKLLLVMLVCAFLLAVFQTAVLSNIRYLPVKPDLMLIFVIYAGIHYNSLYGTLTGFFSGLFIDFLSIAPFGLHSFIFTIVGYTYGFFYGRYDVSAFIFPSVFGVLSTIFKAGLIFILHFLFGGIVQTYNIVSMPFLWELVFNMCFAPMLFFFFDVLLSDNMSRRIRNV